MTKTMQDPVFGMINYANGFWKGHVVLSTLNYESEVVVKAGEDGPTDDQRDWFQQVDGKLNSLVEAIKNRAIQSSRPVPDYRVETVRIFGKNEYGKQWCMINGQDANLRRMASGEYVDWFMSTFYVND